MCKFFFLVVLELIKTVYDYFEMNVAIKKKTPKDQTTIDLSKGIEYFPYLLKFQLRAICHYFEKDIAVF